MTGRTWYEIDKCYQNGKQFTTVDRENNAWYEIDKCYQNGKQFTTVDRENNVWYKIDYRHHHSAFPHTYNFGISKTRKRDYY